MPVFKQKNTKILPKLSKKNSITLDGTHRNFINEFNKDEFDKIPKMKIERKELREKLENTTNIDQIMDYKDKI